MEMTRRSTLGGAVLAIILLTAASVHAQQPPTAVDLCDMVASPSEYNQRVLTVEGILFPGEHSLALYDPSCKPTEQSDVSMQAILPEAWESSPNGKQLGRLLSKGKPASVKVTGTFESGTGRYGPDVARFRFTISAIGAAYPQQPPESKEVSVKPKDGFVPNAQAAVKIAEAVLIPVYGEKVINNERPFKAERHGDVWRVAGTLPCGPTCFGGTAVVKISKTSGEILFMGHYK